MSEAALLRVQGLGRDYDRGRVRALHDVSLLAHRGQTVALTGPSGCGKSTLLSLIGLLDRPDRGSVEVAGVDLGAVRDPFDFRARSVGFVFQFHHMVSTMTLQENVEAPMLALGLSRQRRRERASELLDAMGLGARAAFLPTHVSGGERQRAAVARALANRPALLLADEPTGNLDSLAGAAVVDLLVRHAREQQALLLVATHNPEIAALMDHRIELRDGRQVSASTTALA